MTERMVKVNELILQQLGFIINQELEFPEVMVTILAVDVSPDLRYAKVFMSIFPEERTQETINKLNKSAKLLQKSLGDKVSLRNVPKLNFIFDDTERKAQEIDFLLDNLK